MSAIQSQNVQRRSCQALNPLLTDVPAQNQAFNEKIQSHYKGLQDMPE